MKPCLVCAARVAPDAHHCPSCGCADFGPVEQRESPDESAESSAVEPAPSALNNKPAPRRR